MLFGFSEDTWLIIALAFLGITGLQFLWTWWRELIRDKKSGKKSQFHGNNSLDLMPVHGTAGSFLKRAAAPKAVLEKEPVTAP